MSNLMIYRIREHLNDATQGTNMKPYELRNHMKNLEKLYSEQLSHQLGMMRSLKKDVRCCRENKQRLKNILTKNDYKSYNKFVKDQLEDMQKTDSETINKIPPIINKYVGAVMGFENGRN
jgi:hypothetical protein